MEKNTRLKVLELIKETDPEWAKGRRKEYLCREITDTVIDTWALMAKYEIFEQCEQTELMILYGEKIQENLSRLCKLQGKVIALRKPNTNGITDEMIQNAKDYPFMDLYQFKHGSCVCPFHADKDPSMKLYKNTNTVHCFSCNKSWDTIAFIQELEGITFPEAVRRLQ